MKYLEIYLVNDVKKTVHWYSQNLAERLKDLNNGTTYIKINK